jgi:hypothetical protein
VPPCGKLVRDTLRRKRGQRIRSALTDISSQRVNRDLPTTANPSPESAPVDQECRSRMVTFKFDDDSHHATALTQAK